MKYMFPSTVAASLLLAATVHAASFDCQQARHPVEKIVCANSDLSKLDDELAAAWRASQAACADPALMRLHMQQAWMADIRNYARYYVGDKTKSPADSEKAHAKSLRESYRGQIDLLNADAEECQWLATLKSHTVLPKFTSPLDCSHPADVVEKGICLREYVRKPALKMHAAFVSAVSACADPQVHWRDPLVALLEEAKRTAHENEEQEGVRYTPENVEIGNIHVQLENADVPWNELKNFCLSVPLAERRAEIHITKASKQLAFTIAKLGYTPDDTAARLLVQDAKSRRTLLDVNIPNIVLSTEGGELLVNSARLYDDQGTINVGDFNFDGLDDFAVQIGNEGSYGGPNYAVFLRTPNGFVHNQRMSDLTIEGLGFFGFDAKTKTLSTFSKSGCCDHWETIYKVVSNQPVPVRMTRDLITPDDTGRIEESVYTDGRWKIVKVRKYRPK
ncbi:lysozyme inhibitor LprI family protein [Niveibacterium terrae]|uniref:lysozyme inhibitor LprI family protein n=1 Tax=Niveibacterium terrae TaxID=3373598 RepID=UPI003A8CFE5C